MQLEAEPTRVLRATVPHAAVGGAMSPRAGRAMRMDREWERELVRRVPSDRSAFAELYDFYLPRIYGYIHRRIGERGVSEDLTATTFERSLRAIRTGQFRNEAFSGWLYRVAANAVVDHVRATRRLRADSGVDEVDPGADVLGAALDREELRAAMARLPDTHRRVLAQRFFDDLDPDEAGAILGCSRCTFAVKLHRALAALRSTLAAETHERQATDAA